MNVPCHGCDRREIGCHSICDAYRYYRAEIDAQREKNRRDAPANGFLAEHEIRNEKFRRRTGTSRNSGK